MGEEKQIQESLPFFYSPLLLITVTNSVPEKHYRGGLLSLINLNVLMNIKTISFILTYNILF